MDTSPHFNPNEPRPTFIGNALEKRETPQHLTVEYYKNKSNGIERNSDDVLEAVLFLLTTKSKMDFEVESKLCDNYRADTKEDKQPEYDALSIKEILQLSYLPTLSGISLEEFTHSVKSFERFRAWESKLKTYLDGMSEVDREAFLEKRNRLNEIGLNYYRSVEKGEIEGLGMVSAGGISAISTKTYDSKTARGYRVNIKTNPLSVETSPFVVSELVKRLYTKKDAMNAGFMIKIMHGENSTRDGIIMYVKAGAFTDVVEVVTTYFDDNPSYHDRHADKGIMFGTSLESADKRKFPGIRVTTDPKKPFYTFNYLQAGIISPAVIDYIRKYYRGSHTAMLRHFDEDYFGASEQWEQNFPPIYKNVARDVLGNNQQLDNLAFLGE